MYSVRPYGNRELRVGNVSGRDSWITQLIPADDTSGRDDVLLYIYVDIRS